jgi:hypothetical protein
MMKGDGGIVKYLEKVGKLFFHINDDIPLRLSFDKSKFINYGCCRTIQAGEREQAHS